MEKITPQQALSELRVLCDNFQGNKNQHLFIDKCFEVLSEAIEPKSAEKQPAE